MTAFRIEVSIDTPEADRFCAWLKRQGHDAKVGNSTDNYINDVRTSSDANANAIMTSLWDAYCDD